MISADEIRKAVCRCTGITAYNSMQAVVASSDASRIILLAPTGSGKTIAFAAAMLRRMTTDRPGTLTAAVIAPSRELVRQIADVVRPVASTFGLKTLAVYGGQQFATEEASIRGAVPDIVVATPGRLLDHVDRGTIDLSRVGILVLDEYDKTLELGFHDQMRHIVGCLHALRQSQGFVMVTSATPVERLPEFVDMDSAEIVDCREMSTLGSRLRVVNVPSPTRDKLATLGALVRAVAPDGPCIVFVNHRESADRVGAYLDKEHISAAVYHGGLDQQQREMALARFDIGAARVLVATDLAGRGLDVEGVASVIHYHPATDEAVWTHRNGRTARVDRSGSVYVITSPDEDMPGFVRPDNDFYPDMTATGAVRAPMEAVYIDRGKRDKLSRGDIAGFVMKKAGVAPEAVGKIKVGGNYSLVAVKAGEGSRVVEAARADKVKGVRVRASRME